MKQGIKQGKTRRCHPFWLALLLFWLLLPPPKAEAQRHPHPGTGRRAAAPLPTPMADTVQVQLEAQPDSLVAAPVEPAAIDSARLEWLRTPPSVRELVGDRVGCIETDVPHQFNNSVMAFVTLFTARNRGYMQRVLERENFYFPIFEKYLAQYNLPTDLKYLAVVESALIPTAKSGAGATGLWQFMGPTASDLRLKRDDWIDERMAPEKATEAACKHLRYLYSIFHDWELVLAAYNWGAGSMQRVMRRTGKKNYWDLYPYLPAETRDYVPTFTAIMYSMKYAEAHGLHTDKRRYQYAEALDTLGLRGHAFDLRRLSRACGYPDSLYLTRFNPELRRAMLPAGYRPYVVRFPVAAAAHLGDVDRATLLDYCQPTASLPLLLAGLPPRLAGVEPWTNQQVLAATAGPRTDEEAPTPRFRRVAHRVRRGETLASLAERFEVSQLQLRRWNELAKGRPLRPGKELVLFVPLPPAAPRRATATAELADVPAIVPVPHLVHSALAEEEATARKEQAAANAREVERLQEIARQEKKQEAHLAAIRQRQAAQAAQAAQAEAAAAQARATTRRLAQAQAAQAAQESQAAREVQEAQAQAKAEEQAQAKAEAKTLADAEKQPLETKRPAPKNPKTPSTPAAEAADEPAAAPAVAQAAERRVRAAASAVASAKAALVLPVAPAPYTVRKGDYLTKLAREHHLSLAQLVAWNGLESETVVPGQRLVFIAPIPANHLRKDPSVSNPPEADTKMPDVAAPAHLAAGPGKRAVAAQVHLVQRGDTLFNISRRFGVSVQVLRELNHLTSDDVKLGQKLLVPQG